MHERSGTIEDRFIRVSILLDCLDSSLDWHRSGQITLDRQRNGPTNPLAKIEASIPTTKAVPISLVGSMFPWTRSVVHRNVIDLGLCDAKFGTQLPVFCEVSKINSVLCHRLQIHEYMHSNCN